MRYEDLRGLVSVRRLFPRVWRVRAKSRATEHHHADQAATIIIARRETDALRHGIDMLTELSRKEDKNDENK